jgi:hypothetical protein
LQELGRGVQAVAPSGGASCASQVLDRCARPLPAAPLVVRCRYLIVVSRPLHLAALVVHRRYLIAAPGRCPRRRSLCVAGT